VSGLASFRVSVSSIYGVNYRVKEQITMARSLFPRSQRHQNRDRCHSARNFRANGIEVVTGTASFLDPHHMQVTSSRGQVEFEAGNIVIATGTNPPFLPWFLSTTLPSSTAIKFCACR